MLFNNAETKQAIKGHKCICCERVIHPTEQYTVCTSKTIDGKISSYKICLVCSFLQTIKEGKNANCIVPGEFTEKKMPNCLRKVREEFYENMLACMKKYGKDIPPEPIDPKPVSRIVVKASQIGNKIVHVPVTKQYTLDRFKVGNKITLSAGVSGQKRIATIKTVKEVDGKSFGNPGKYIALFLEK